METIDRFHNEFKIVRMSTNSLVLFNSKYGEVYISRKDFNNLIKAVDYRVVRKENMHNATLWLSILTWSWDGEIVKSI